VIICSFFYENYFLGFRSLDLGFSQEYGVADFHILGIAFVGKAPLFDIDFGIPFDPPILSLQMDITTYRISIFLLHHFLNYVVFI